MMSTRTRICPLPKGCGRELPLVHVSEGGNWQYSNAEFKVFYPTCCDCENTRSKWNKKKNRLKKTCFKRQLDISPAEGLDDMKAVSVLQLILSGQSTSNILIDEISPNINFVIPPPGLLTPAPAIVFPARPEIDPNWSELSPQDIDFLSTSDRATPTIMAALMILQKGQCCFGNHYLGLNSVRAHLYPDRSWTAVRNFAYLCPDCNHAMGQTPLAIYLAENPHLVQRFFQVRQLSDEAWAEQKQLAQMQPSRTGS